MVFLFINDCTDWDIDINVITMTTILVFDSTFFAICTDKAF